MISGPVSPGESMEILTLTLNNHGQEPIIITELIFSQESTATAGDIERVQLYHQDVLIDDGTYEGNLLSFNDVELIIESFSHLVIKFTPSENAEIGHAICFELLEVGTDAGVTYGGEKVSAYISEAPTSPVVDGLFEEWSNPLTDEINDVSNPNVDISAYDSKNHDLATYFYLKVEGKILHGNAVPASNRAMNIPSKPSSGGDTTEPSDEPASGTQEENPLPVETAEDAIYIFLDTLPEQGYENPNIEFGADYMIEIKGQDGVIHSAKYFEFNGESPDTWSWRFVKDVDAASGLNEIETTVDELPNGIYYHMVSWDDEEDFSDVITIHSEPSQVDDARPDPIPEFHALILPTAGIIGLFVIFRRKRLPSTNNNLSGRRC
jgi:hypothetical protein